MFKKIHTIFKFYVYCNCSQYFDNFNKAWLSVFFLGGGARHGTRGILFTNHRWNRGPLQWNHVVLTSGSSRKSSLGDFFFYLVPQMIKNLPAMQETWVWSPGQEDPLEKGMATHSSILAQRIPWTEEPGRLQSVRSQRVGHDWVTNTFTIPKTPLFFSIVCLSSRL